MSRAWPPTRSISRDVNGVTHIAAGTSHDLFFAQGWVHASERMWQMEIWRRIGAGTPGRAVRREPGRHATGSSARSTGAAPPSATSPPCRTSPAPSSTRTPPASTRSSRPPGPPSACRSWSPGARRAGHRPGGSTSRALDTARHPHLGKVQAWALGGNLDSEIFRMLADAQLGRPRAADGSCSRPTTRTSRSSSRRPARAGRAAAGRVRGADRRRGAARDRRRAPDARAAGPSSPALVRASRPLPA